MQGKICITAGCGKPLAKGDGRYCVNHTKLPVDREVEAFEEPRCAVIARKGITTSESFAQFMSALMSDVVTGAIEPDVATAACKAGDKLLQVVSMSLKHGSAKKDGNRVLHLYGTSAEPAKQLQSAADEEDEEVTA